jgi:predicted alpha/beta superfamily hydrolase
MRNRIQLVFLTLIFLIACSPTGNKKENNELLTRFSQFSESVKDTFHIDVQLPKEYFTKPRQNYPVVILLDGNFYFPMMSSIIHQYESTGLLKPVILIGVGYKSYPAMDSLRVRDYLYPLALPSDELKTPGGGQNFKDYLTKELIPEIDSRFRTEKNNRALLGHSFGGYFVLYSLSDQLKNKTHDFKTFISASPTLWYNNFYLNKLPGQLKTNADTLNLFISVGALEDPTWSVKPLIDLSAEIEKAGIKEIAFKSRIYNHLDHMDLGVLSFTKGLQDFMMDEE